MKCSIQERNVNVLFSVDVLSNVECSVMCDDESSIVKQVQRSHLYKRNGAQWHVSAIGHNVDR